jgi:hypothetical protein
VKDIGGGCLMLSKVRGCSLVPACVIDMIYSFVDWLPSSPTALPLLRPYTMLVIGRRSTASRSRRMSQPAGTQRRSLHDLAISSAQHSTRWCSWPSSTSHRGCDSVVTTCLMRSGLSLVNLTLF